MFPSKIADQVVASQLLIKADASGQFTFVDQNGLSILGVSGANQLVRSDHSCIEILATFIDLI